MLLDDHLTSVRLSLLIFEENERAFPKHFEWKTSGRQ